jgi:hypothetical protein
VAALLAAGLARVGPAGHVEPTLAGVERARQPIAAPERLGHALAFGEGPLEIEPCERHAGAWTAWRLEWDLDAQDQVAAQLAGQRLVVWPDSCGLCSADFGHYD